MRTSFHHQPEAQHPKSSTIHKSPADYPIFGPICGLKSDISRGPRSAKSPLMHWQQKHGRSRWNIFKQRAEPRCENSILHKKSVEKKTVSIAGFLIYPSLWAIIVYGAVMHIRSVRPQAT